MPFNVVIGKPLGNPFVKDGKALMSKIEAAENAKQGVLKAVDAIGGFRSIINDGDKVLVKPNYNSPGTPPASTDPEFLKALVELLFESGAGKVVVGESSSLGKSLVHLKDLFGLDRFDAG